MPDYLEAMEWLKAHCARVTNLFKDLNDNWPGKNLRLSLDNEGYLQVEGDMKDDQEDFNDARDGFTYYRRRMNDDFAHMRNEWPDKDIELEIVEEAAVLRRIKPS